MRVRSSVRRPHAARHRTDARPTRGAARARLVVGLGAALALALGACSDSDDDDDGGGVIVGDDTLIIGGASGPPASEVGTEEILRSASTQASAGLGLNLDNLQRLDDDDQTGDGSDDPLLTLDEGSEGFISRTLDADERTDRVDREGDVITIDPDEARLCADEEAASFDDDLPDLFSDDGDDGAFDDDGTSACQQLLADLSVRVDAVTEDSGVASYLFGGTPVLAIGYSPGGGVYELSLAGLQRVLQRVDAIFGGGDGSDGIPSTMRGTLRLSGRVLEDAAGSESGELELSVTEAIEIADDGDPNSFSLAPSQVFLISSDAATGRATMRVGWGALRLVAEDDDSDDGGGSSLTALNLGGLGFTLEASEDSGTLTLRDGSLGGVPLNVEVDGVSSLSLALAPLGMSVDTETGALTFDTPLGVELMVDNLTGLLDDLPPEYTATFEAMAPAGTRLVEQDNGATRVDAGGPLTASFVASDNGGSVQQELSADAGSCFGADEEAENDLELSSLACD